MNSTVVARFNSGPSAHSFPPAACAARPLPLPDTGRAHALRPSRMEQSARLRYGLLRRAGPQGRPGHRVAMGQVFVPADCDRIDELNEPGLFMLVPMLFCKESGAGLGDTKDWGYYCVDLSCASY